MSKMDFSRRTFLKGAAAGAGAMAAAKLSGGIKDAQAQTVEKSALVILHLQGGFNALFGSADSFLGAGTFGVNANNILRLQNGLVVDSSFNVLSQFAKDHMASVAFAHGSSDHGNAARLVHTVNNLSGQIMLASAMGGDAALKAVNVGTQRTAGPGTAINGITLQAITDMKTTVDALTGGANNPINPDRAIAANGMVNADKMSALQYLRSPKSSLSVKEGYSAAIATLRKPIQPFNYANTATAYGMQANATAVNSITSKFLAAEVMIQAGANVVAMADGFNWDSHGDTSGSAVRTRFQRDVIPGLKAFLDRMLNLPDRNVVVAITGDFARSLPGSDHAPVLVPVVFGKYVKNGTTGKVNANVGLPAGAPTTAGFWAFLAAALKTKDAPFGANPHALVI